MRGWHGWLWRLHPGLFSLYVVSIVVGITVMKAGEGANDVFGREGRPYVVVPSAQPVAERLFMQGDCWKMCPFAQAVACENRAKEGFLTNFNDRLIFIIDHPVVEYTVRRQETRSD